MEFLDVGTWVQYFLLVISGCLALLLLLLFYTNRYTREKINQMKENEEGLDSYSDFIKPNLDNKRDYNY
ncbi:hypothetical protein [Bacillus sp. USDA818B3_A]|uniref:hypothetical protein n=1 Tax=Bacillus sp. USDA818B3_A TaxID=2698834 RepID=UPI00136989FD|nr:hypothetical protein [Bacillus sp. USDA818B3_A]